MLGYVIAGLVLGAIYAAAAAGLVVTYVSAGVINFAFGSMAFVIARFYYWLVVTLGWSTLPAAILALLLVSPVLGIGLWFLVFRQLQLQPQLVRIVVTVGLGVALPPVAFLMFGVEATPQAVGLVREPSPVLHLLGTVLNLNQLIVLVLVAALLIAGTVLLRFTTAGLRIRALVDSQALSSLSGTDPARVSAAVWAGSAVLAGLVGILVAPTNGLDVGPMTSLMASAFAAVVAARLTSLPVAVLVSLGMGVASGLVQFALPANSPLAAAVLPSIPFVIMLIFLLVYVAQGGRSRDRLLGGALDKAIAPVTTLLHAGAGRKYRRSSRRRRTCTGVAVVVLAVVLPPTLNEYWLGLAAQGLAYGVVFLAFTLVTGEGGMIWLCVATFAGGGAVIVAQLTTVLGAPLLLSVLVAAVSMGVVGMLIALMTLRLGDLFVSLATLSFGLLVETLVFSLPTISNYNAGVAVPRPEFAVSDLGFSYLCIAVLVIVGLFVVNLRRSTAGLALSAMRSSETATRTLGISVIHIKIIVSGLAAFIAGLGGVLLAMYSTTAAPESYLTFSGLIWIAVLVTVGVRSVGAAVLAGLLFAVMPGVFNTYLPPALGQLPPFLFGLGAIGLAANPNGVLATHARQISHGIERLLRRTRGGHERLFTDDDAAPADEVHSIPAGR